MFAGESLTQYHPERVGDRGVVASGEHEPVGIRMLGSAVVISQATQIRADEVACHSVWCVGERAAEVSGLGIVAEKHQCHGG